MKVNGAGITGWKALAARFSRMGAEAVAKSPFWPYYLALAHACLPVAVWRGATAPHGRQGSLLVVGKEPWVCHLPDRFFSGTPRRERIGRFPVWTLPNRLKRLQQSVDLTIIRASRMTARLFPERDYLRGPEWIDARLRLPTDPTAPLRISKNLRGGDLRVVRRSRLKAFVSHELSDFEEFYDHMHAPFVRNRFGVLGTPKNRESLRAAFQRGGILWVHRDGDRLAGALIENRGQLIVLNSMGTRNGELGLVKEGVFAAVYQYCIEYAREQGCTHVGLGTSRAFLQDGVLRYKRKWGSVFNERPDAVFYMLMCWNRLQGVVADFLSQTSPVFHEAGGLAAAYALDAESPVGSEEVLAARNSMWFEGLNRLYLISSAGWSPGVSAPPDTVLIDALETGGTPFWQNRQASAR